VLRLLKICWYENYQVRGMLMSCEQKCLSLESHFSGLYDGSITCRARTVISIVAQLALGIDSYAHIENQRSEPA